MKSKKLFVLALSLMMVLSMSYSVFAAGNGANSGNNSGADSYSSTEANLVKYLQMPEGINDPGETFTFTFTPAAPTNTTYGVPVQNDSQKEGYWGPVSTTIASSGMQAVTTGNAEDTGNKVGTKTIASIFTGYTFPRAGEYSFTVAETEGNTEGMTYSKDTYKLRLMVNNDKEITDVTVEKTTPSSGDNGQKVDPTDTDPTNNNGGNTSGGDPSPADSLGGFTFTNSYTKDVTTHDEPTDPNPDTNPDDPENPDPIDEDTLTEDVGGAYVLDKFVLGEYGDQTNDFVFTVTVTLPKLSKDFDFTGANAPTVTENKGSISGTWADGQAVTVNLKHEGKLTFPELPIGTKIEVSEAAVAGYKQVLTTSEADDAAKVTVTEDAGGYAIMRNSFDDESVTPTGIVINNLPYVLLIGLALGGIVLFSRKKRYE